MKPIGILTWEACQECKNYDQKKDTCKKEAEDIITELYSDGEGLFCGCFEVE